MVGILDISERKQMLVRSLSVLVAVASFACANPTEPRAIPIQFDVITAQGALDIVTVRPEPASVTVSTNYVGVACNPLGAFARRRGSTLQLIVTPQSKSACAGPAVLYVYHAKLLGLDGGTYTLELYHGKQNGSDLHLIESTSVEIPAGAI